MTWAETRCPENFRCERLLSVCMSPGGVSEGIGQLKTPKILQKMGVLVETLAQGDGEMFVLLNALGSVTQIRRGTYAFDPVA